MLLADIYALIGFGLRERLGRGRVPAGADSGRFGDLAGGLLDADANRILYLRPYRDEPSASRPIRADKHRRGQRVLTWVTSREHCAAAGIFLHRLSLWMNRLIFL